MDKVNKFLKEYWTEILGWIIGLLGVVASVVSAFALSSAGYFSIYVAVLVAQTLVVFIGSQYLSLKYSFKATEKELEEKCVLLQDNINIAYEKQKADKEIYDKNVSTIISNIKNASKLNNDFCNRIPEVNEKSYHILEILQTTGTQNFELMQEEVKKAIKDLSLSMFDLYKRYSTNFLSYVVNMIEAYLRVRGIAQDVSATIKLFDRPLVQLDNRRNIVVYTAFRDKKTYDTKEREIGQMRYTIDGNVDFSMCLSKEHFIINNAQKGSANYFNEHTDFDAYYNCAVVVALKTKQADNSFKFFGYLCCDCINNDGDNIFDKETAQLLFSMAQQYGSFLETLESNWLDRTMSYENLPDTFLNIIFEETIKKE